MTAKYPQFSNLRAVESCFLYGRQDIVVKDSGVKIEIPQNYIQIGSLNTVMWLTVARF